MKSAGPKLSKTVVPLTDPESPDQEVPLGGMLAEYRSALYAEIEAAQRNASSQAIPLSNGERIGKVGHVLQYRFTVDSFLNLPGDTPGDLIIPGTAPIPITMVGID